MKHWVTYPLVTHPSNPELVSKDALSRFARTAEAAGFDGIGFTDHPAPSHKWLQAGGHDALKQPDGRSWFLPTAVRARLLDRPEVIKALGNDTIADARHTIQA